MFNITGLKLYSRSLRFPAKFCITLQNWNGQASVIDDAANYYETDLDSCELHHPYRHLDAGDLGVSEKV